MQAFVTALSDSLVLGSLLEELSRSGPYEIVAHWTQGEFHHDVVIRWSHRILVVATNCNGGVKEVLAFDDVPERHALWHWRCPHVADFSGEIPKLLARATTEHFFDPCELLRPDARSELKPEYREQQLGGGWELALRPKRCS